MKRTLILFLVFALLFGTLLLTGCGDGPVCGCYDMSTTISYGIWSRLMLVPVNMSNNADDVILSQERASDGTGRNGYITVRYAIKDTCISNLWINYPEFKFKVYDDSVLVGAVEYRAESVVLRDTATINDTVYFVGYMNVEISEYINGNYTFEIDYFRRNYWRTDACFNCY